MKEPFSAENLLQRLGFTNGWEVVSCGNSGDKYIVTASHRRGLKFRLAILYSLKLDKVINISYSKEEE